MAISGAKRPKGVTHWFSQNRVAPVEKCVYKIKYLSSQTSLQAYTALCKYMRYITSRGAEEAGGEKDSDY